MPLLRTAPIALLAAAAVVLPGCGEASLDTAALAEKANAICAPYNAKLKAIAEEPSDQAETLAYLKAAKAITDGMREDLDDLAPSNAGQWNTILDKYDASTATVSDAISALQVGDAEGYATAAAAISASTDELNAAFDAIGARTCGSASTD